MTQQYYGDAMANYLIILCPKEALEGYQYRMLAVNRIRGLLPCSLRTIDGETFLYYEITSRQSLARKYEHRRISGEEMKKILYSVTEMLKSLSEYLLDETHLLMDPEYIFYDVETEGYWFTYYPEQRDTESVEKLLEYLAEKTDPDAAEASAVIYRLCDLASSPGFILREEVLDSEYEQASLRGFRTASTQQTTQEPLPPDRNPDLRLNHGAGREYGGDSDEDDFPEMEKGEHKAGRRHKNKSSASGTKSQRAGGAGSGQPAGLLILAALFLAAAAGIGAAEQMLSVSGTQQVAMRAGMIVCLILSIFVAIYGTIYTWHKNRKEEQEEKLQQEEERRNAMMPSTEYNASTTGRI